MALPIKEKSILRSRRSKEGEQISHQAIVCAIGKISKKRPGVTRSLDTVHASMDQIDASSHVPV